MTGTAPPIEFPIFSGGPLYRLQQRIRLIEPSRRRLGLAALYAVLITWLPMVFLSASQGLAIGPTHLESFLMDFEVAARCLVTIPAFLFGETVCGAQLLAVVRQFLDADVVTGEARARFKELVEQTVRQGCSNRVEMALLVLAYIHSLIVFVYILNYPDATWRLTIRDGHYALSLAGAWYFLVAFPLFSLLFLRWIWRITLWWRMLWRISKLELRLTAAHRDEAGGLGFLSQSLQAFSLFAFGAMALAAGAMADFILYGGDTIAQHQWEIGGLALVLLLLIAGPLLVFIPRLYEAKESAVFQYGALTSRHLQKVDRKWLSESPLDEDVGIDFRAVAHMGTSMKAVREMSIIPIYKDDVLKLLFVALAPFVPLLATLIPLDEVLKLLLKVVM